MRNLNLMKKVESVENALGKEEIARYKQFILFLLCFQKTFSVDE